MAMVVNLWVETLETAESGNREAGVGSAGCDRRVSSFLEETTKTTKHTSAIGLQLTPYTGRDVRADPLSSFSQPDRVREPR